MLIFLVGGIYFYTISPTLSFGDAGDLIAAAASLGVPHPPGYPLHTLLGWLFIKLIPFGSIALRVTMVSTIASILTVMLVYQIIYRLTKNQIVAIAGSLLLAFSSAFWTYSIVAEVFALDAFFTALLIWLLLQLEEEAYHGKNRLLPIFAFIYGLALTNHQIIILLVPAFLIMIIVILYRTSRFRGKQSYFRLLSFTLLGFFLGLLLYLYIPLAAFRHPALNWGAVDSLRSFYDFVTREIYGSTRLISSLASVKHSIASPVFQIVPWFTLTLNQFLIIGIPLFFVGVYALRQRPWLLLFLLYGSLVPSLGFMMYANLAMDQPAARAIMERFLIMPGIFLVIISGCGLHILYDRVVQYLQPRLKWARTMATVMALSISVIPLPIHWQGVSQKDQILFYEYGKLVLESAKETVILRKNNGEPIPVPDRVLLLTSGDQERFTIDYLQLAEQQYPGIIVLNLEMLTYPWYVKEIKKRFPEVVIPFTLLDRKKGALLDLVRSNIDQFSIQLPYGVFPELESFYFLLPHGARMLVLKRASDIHIDWVRFVETNTRLFDKDTLLTKIVVNNTLQYNPRYPWTLWLKEVAKQYAAFRTNLGTFYLNTYSPQGPIDPLMLAIEEFKIALAVAPERDEALVRFQLGTAYQRQGDLPAALSQYERVLQMDPNFSPVYYNRVSLFLQQGKKEQAIDDLEHYLQLNPNHPDKKRLESELDQLRQSR